MKGRTAVVTGSTASTNLPVRNAAQSTYGGAGDMFVARFAPGGQIAYATYLGGAGFDAAARALHYAAPVGEKTVACHARSSGSRRSARRKSRSAWRSSWAQNASRSGPSWAGRSSVAAPGRSSR